MPAAQQIAPNPLVYNKVCLIDGGVPRDQTYLRMGAIRYPLQYYSHSQATSGIISNTLSHSITTSTIISTAIDDSIGLDGGTDYGMGTFEFCFNNGPTPVANMSMAFDDMDFSGDDPSETESDFYTDFLATKIAPFPLYIMSAGNSAGRVPTPWVQNRGYNSLIVAASDDKGSPSINDHSIASFSSWVNPPKTHGDYELPHLAAPGVGIASANMTYLPDVTVQDTAGDYCPANLDGTSFSAPQVTGVAELVFNMDPGNFYGFPEMLKAVLMASTSINVDGGHFTNLLANSTTDRKDGVGVLDAYAAVTLGSSAYRSSPGADATSKGRWAGTIDLVSGFDANNFSYDQWNLVADQTGRMRIVATWTGTPLGCNYNSGSMSAGDVFPRYCNSNQIDADLDLIVFNTTSVGAVYYSDSYDSSWEGCDFPVTKGEKFVARIIRSQRYNSSTVLAVAWNNYSVSSAAVPALSSIGSVALMLILIAFGTIMVRGRISKAVASLALLCAFFISCGRNDSLTDVDASSREVAVVDSHPTPDASISFPDAPMSLDSVPSLDLPIFSPDSIPLAVDTVTLDSSGITCPGLIGTSAEIASTPRQYQGLELVATNLDGNRIVASESAYDRVVTDVTAIATMNSSVAYTLGPTPTPPAVSGYASLMPPSGSMSGKTLILTVDNPTYASMQAGIYTAWDCLNSYYGLTTTLFQTFANANSVSVVLKGIYNTEMILGLYTALPGVVSAVSGGVPSDAGRNSIQHICAGKVNGAYQYAFMFGSGDCQSGCIKIEYDCYGSTAAGVVAPLYGGVDGGQTQCMDLYAHLCQAYQID